MEFRHILVNIAASALYPGLYIEWSFARAFSIPREDPDLDHILFFTYIVQGYSVTFRNAICDQF